MATDNTTEHLKYGPANETWQQAEKRWIKAYKKLSDIDAEYIYPCTAKAAISEADIAQAEQLYFIPESIKRMYRKAGNGHGNEFNGWGFDFYSLNKFKPLLSQLLIHWRDVKEPEQTDITDWYVNELAKFTPEEATFINDHYRVFGCYWFRDEWPCYLFYGKNGRFGAHIFNQDRWSLNHLVNKDFFLLRYATVDELVSRLVTVIISAQILEESSIYSEEAYVLLDRALPGQQTEEEKKRSMPQSNELASEDIRADTERPFFSEAEKDNLFNALRFDSKTETWQQAEQRFVSAVKTVYAVSKIKPVLFVSFTTTEINDLEREYGLPQSVIQFYNGCGKPFASEQANSADSVKVLFYYSPQEIKPLFYRIAIDALDISQPTQADMEHLQVDGQTILLDKATIQSVNENYKVLGSIKLPNQLYYLLFDKEGKFGVLYYEKRIFWHQAIFDGGLQLTRYSTIDELLSRLFTVLIHTAVFEEWEPAHNNEELYGLVDKADNQNGERVNC